MKCIKNLKRQCVTSDLSERFSDFKSIKKVIQQYFKLNRNVIEIILETLESYAQDRDRVQKAHTARETVWDSYRMGPDSVGNTLFKVKVIP